MKLFHYQLIILLVIVSGCGIILGQGWLLFQQHHHNKFLFEGTVHRILEELREEIESVFVPQEGSKEKYSKRKKDGTFMGKVLELDFVYPPNFSFKTDTTLTKKRISQAEEFIKKIEKDDGPVEFLESIVINYQQGPNFKTRHFKSIDYVNFDSLIPAKLALNNIDLPYEAGFGFPEQEKWVYKTVDADTLSLLNSKFQTSLFWEGGRLYLRFPEKQNYFFEQLTFNLGASLLLITSVFASFWYALSIILKQKKLSELKNDFINNMTHEFKTPIATIAFAIANIENQKILQKPEAILQYTKIIKEENKRMNRQVEQVLSASIADKKAFELKLAPFNIHEMLNQIGDAAELKLQAENGILKRRLNAAQAIIRGDQFHLSNVIANLLDNAQKYATGAPIIILYTESDENGLYIKVKDNGMGMTKEAQAKVFEKFYRVPMGNLHNIKGFGLGLSYAKAIIEQHDGAISVESKLGKGSTFTLFIPFENENEI